MSPEGSAEASFWLLPPKHSSSYESSQGGLAQSAFKASQSQDASSVGSGNVMSFAKVTLLKYDIMGERTVAMLQAIYLTFCLSCIAIHVSYMYPELRLCVVTCILAMLWWLATMMPWRMEGGPGRVKGKQAKQREAMHTRTSLRAPLELF